MRASHYLIDGYLMFGIPKEERSEKTIHAELNVASARWNNCIKSMDVSRTYIRLSGDDDTAQF